MRCSSVPLYPRFRLQISESPGDYYSFQTNKGRRFTYPALQPLLAQTILAACLGIGVSCFVGHTLVCLATLYPRQQSELDPRQTLQWDVSYAVLYALLVTLVVHWTMPEEDLWQAANLALGLNLFLYFFDQLTRLVLWSRYSEDVVDVVPLLVDSAILPELGRPTRNDTERVRHVQRLGAELAVLFQRQVPDPFPLEVDVLRIELLEATTHATPRLLEALCVYLTAISLLVEDPAAQVPPGLSYILDWTTAILVKEAPQAYWGPILNALRRLNAKTAARTLIQHQWNVSHLELYLEDATQRWCKELMVDAPPPPQGKKVES